MQGMLLLAGSTTVYDVLPSAGEDKKRHLQVAAPQPADSPLREESCMI